MSGAFLGAWHGARLVTCRARRRACCAVSGNEPALTGSARRTPQPCARRRWAPRLSRGAPRKKAAHTAMSDIKESLEELRYYQAKLFKNAK